MLLTGGAIVASMERKNMRAPAKKVPTEPLTKSNFGPSDFAAVTWDWKCRRKLLMISP